MTEKQLAYRLFRIGTAAYKADDKDFLPHDWKAISESHRNAWFEIAAYVLCTFQPKRKVKP